MATETKPTTSHIQFAPLILERKTPAEEITEISATLCMEHNLHDVLKSLDNLKARLEAPDEPKRWDGVFPWVRRNIGTGDFLPVVCLGKDLALYSDGNAKTDHLCNPNQSSRPYHDGVIITITAGS